MLFRSRKNRHRSTLSDFMDEDIFVSNEHDTRDICHKCVPYSDNLTRPVKPGGTWCYAVSLRGARKILNYMKNVVDDHIDSFFSRMISQKKLTAYAFDPPIVMHDMGMLRPDTDIPWVY